MHTTLENAPLCQARIRLRDLQAGLRQSLKYREAAGREHLLGILRKRDKKW